jgi:hypothetical protein
MELVQQSPSHQFELEDNPWLERALFLMVGVGGLLMWLVIMNNYGAMAWYRSSYQIGLGLTIVGFLMYFFLGFRSFFQINRTQQQVLLRHKKGLRTIREERFPLSEITDLRVDKKTSKRLGSVYRISIERNGQTWIPLSPRFVPDLYAIESRIDLPPPRLAKFSQLAGVHLLSAATLLALATSLCS